MTELLMLQIILGILLWTNAVTTLGIVFQMAETNPCPIDHWLAKSIGYTTLYVIAFFIWPMRLVKIWQ